MRRLGAVLLAILVVGSAVGAPAIGAATGGRATGPAVTVTVDGSTVGEGDRHETNADDRIAVEAAVADEAAAGTTLAEIVVRVDGERAASWTVNGTSATRRVRPDYGQGNNTVRVIVTDSADNVNATRFTVFQDGVPPHVFLTAPYETAPWHDITDGTVAGTHHALAGEIRDASSVDRVVVAHSFGTEGSRTMVSDPGEAFSVPLELGYSANGSVANVVRIEAVDEFGNTRDYQFEVNVTDDGPPALSVGPLPNETSRNRIVLDGTVGDDVWVRSTNVTVDPLDRNASAETTHVVGPRAYDYGGDGRNATFSEPVHLLHPGTYRITVNATDVTGASTSRSVTVERLPHEAADLRPTLAVDRDRTVVTDNETLFLSGAAFEGVTRRLVVETRDLSGDTVDYQVVHDGADRDRVAFDREVGIVDGRTRVIVRASDPHGHEVNASFWVDGASRATFVGNATDETDEASGPAGPLVRVTHLQDERPGTASSSVTVRRAPAGETVVLPPADGPATVAAAPNVTLLGLDLTVGGRTNLTGTVVVRDRAGGSLRGPPDARPAGTVSVQHAVPDGRVDGLVLSVRVDRSYLAARGFDPANLSLYRASGGTWSQLDTAVVERSDGVVRYRAQAPGLSTFSLAATSRADAPGNGSSAGPASGNATRPSANGTDAAGTTNGTVGNETALPDGATGENAGNETANATGSDEPRIFVANVTVNRTRVGVNETVLVNATLVNDGNATGTYVAGLRTIHDTNLTVAGRQTRTVPAGAERTVRFTTAFAEPGNHTVAVNGTRAGPVVVSGGGGLLSVFAFVPLRLVGMVLGGVAGLLVVLTLVRFALRRVGGDEASG